MMTKGKLIVITGPSGVGKGTLLRELVKRHPELYLSVSATTRSPRPGETNGKNYHFVTLEEFQEMIGNQELLEWAEYAGHYYGTPRAAVENQLEQGRWVILEIELVGARQIKNNFDDTLFIFILPPSWPELEQRLRNRADVSESAMKKRLEKAAIEIQSVDEFDYQIVNDELDKAVAEIEQAIFS